MSFQATGPTSGTPTLAALRQTLAPRHTGIYLNKQPNNHKTFPLTNVRYRGVAPASEVETQGVIAHISSVAAKQDIKLYIDWHSFGNLIISPWGYTCSVLPLNNNEMVTLARETADVIESVYGTTWV